MTISRSSTPSSSWADAVDAAETMTAWHRRHVQDVDEVCWSDVVQLLALALWRVAKDQNVAIGDAALDGEVFGYLGRASLTRVGSSSDLSRHPRVASRDAGPRADFTMPISAQRQPLDC